MKTFRRPWLVAHGIAATQRGDNAADAIAARLTRSMQIMRQGVSFAPMVHPAHLINWGDLLNSLAMPAAPGLADRLQALALELPLAGLFVDYLQDVPAYAGPSRLLIKAKFRRELERAGRGAVLCAHSLASIVALDLLGDYLEAGEIAEDIPPEEWPICALLTFGSPCRLSVPGFEGIGYLDREARFRALPPAPPAFMWLDFANASDPIVTGAVFGLELAEEPPTLKLEEIPGYARAGASTYLVGGNNPLTAHTAYPDDLVLASMLQGLILPRRGF